MAEDQDDDRDIAAELESEFQELMGKSVAEILEIGKKALFARLVSSVQLGHATHQEAAILRNILRDNGLTMGIPSADNYRPVGDQPGLPETDIPDYGEPEYGKH